jgi:hypothetical protein
MTTSDCLPGTGPLGQSALWALLAGALLIVPAPAQQIEVLQKIPQELIRHTGGARPNREGMVGHNGGGFRSPGFQRDAARYLIRGVMRSDTKMVDDAWRAIDATFERQKAEGHFGKRHDSGGVAFWLCELDQALLVLRQSRLGPQYEKRIAAVVPRIHKAARWLALPEQQEALRRGDAETPNRLLFDALAYGLSGLLADDAELKTLGRRFVDLAVAKYRASDGVFLERGGHDSSYQAVAAWLLQVWVIYFPDEKLDALIGKAVRWEIGRVKPSGEIDAAGNTRTGLGQEIWQGKPKDVNYSEVTLCLLYYHARTGDQDSLAAARRIVEYRRKKKG